MRNKPIQADQLIPTSSTPPPEAGFYRIDRKTIGVVGNMSFRDPNTQAMMPVGKGAIPFPDFAPRLLAALVANSTAACTSGVVTVTATAHGIPATVFDAYQIYYPGSASLAAGWYSGLARASADALTFSADCADFTSESVNAGAIVTAEVTYYDINLPENTIQLGDIVSVRAFRHGDALTSLKLVRLRLGSANLVQHNVSSGATNGVVTMAFSATKTGRQDGSANIENDLSSSRQSGAAALSATNTLSVTGQLAAAGQYVAFSAAKIRIE